MKKRIFISSVQGEFAEERKLLKDYIEKSPFLRRFFDVFVFEGDVPSVDKRADEVYLEELSRSQIYIALIGERYCGGQLADPSPTEREYDAATRLGLKRLVFVKSASDATREPRERAFLDRISRDLTWHAYDTTGDLLNWVLASLDKTLDESGVYRTVPFDRAPCDGASTNDLDPQRVAWFLRQARALRGLKMAETASMDEVLTHFKLLLDDGHAISNAAILLFGKDPQSFLLSSEIKCAHWPTCERRKPILSYQIYKGTLFELIDMAVEFVLARIDLSVGTRDVSPQAPRDWEIPKSVVAEAIANAVAHRDYASTGSVQVELFPDRLLVMNPGTINPGLTKEMLFKVHASYPNNPRIADPLFYTKHIERLGTGLTDLFDACRAASLPDPKIEIEGGTYSITIFRSTRQVADKNGGLKSGVVDKDKILSLISSNPRITISAISSALGCGKRTVERIVSELKSSGTITRIGSRKSGYWQLLNKS